MNRTECDILKLLAEKTYTSQREISEATNYSLGIVNRSLRFLINNNYIDREYRPLFSAIQRLKDSSPQNAVILAAGYGMRMVPINLETPKGLLEIKGEALIERIIRQLHDAGIQEIYIVAGFMKEHYEYLIDKYQVELIVNPDYSSKNNLYSLEKALPHLLNTYIIPCDIWCRQNPFSKYELYSWYMVSDARVSSSPVRINRNHELVLVEKGCPGNAMIGISYLEKTQTSLLYRKIRELCESGVYHNSFWEEALYQNNRMIVQAKIVSSSDVIEINTYEQLRDLDSNSNQLQSAAIEMIVNVLNINPADITEITISKKGMTNRSFLFKCLGKRYIMRIPGEGTGQLINRAEEAEVYYTIKDKCICDNFLSIDVKTGYKLTEFIEHSRTCDPLNMEDVTKCMARLRNFHEMNLQVNHEFNLFDKIDFYESLWIPGHSVYKDYTITKENVLSLKHYIDTHVFYKTLTHIDAVPDNFLFTQNADGDEKIYLIDWEYAGMQDPHVDIAMFGIYSLYNKEQIDKLIQTYFKGNCDNDIKIKIYCYISVCGLLWSNWCEYKRNLGVDFGEYALRQYRYAKEYYRIVCNELGEERKKWGIR